MIKEEEAEEVSNNTCSSAGERILLKNEEKWFRRSVDGAAVATFLCKLSWPRVVSRLFENIFVACMLKWTRTSWL